MTKLFARLCTTIMCIAFALSAAAQSDADSALKEISAHRKKQQAEMKKKDSPLLKEDRRKFRGLNYYPADLSYRVYATFVKTQNPALFKMKTTTARLPDYVKYGELHFTLDTMNYVLEVYQSPDIIKRPGYRDYLFVPFTDETNGVETYEVGRYLEMRIPSSDVVVLDFNLAYNPYCSYNPTYSCPIPPEVNHLPIAVRAGEKKFKDTH